METRNNAEQQLLAYQMEPKAYVKYLSYLVVDSTQCKEMKVAALLQIK